MGQNMGSSQSLMGANASSPMTGALNAPQRLPGIQNTMSPVGGQPGFQGFQQWMQQIMQGGGRDLSGGFNYGKPPIGGSQPGSPQPGGPPVPPGQSGFNPGDARWAGQYGNSVVDPNTGLPWSWHGDPSKGSMYHSGQQVGTGQGGAQFGGGMQQGPPQFSGGLQGQSMSNNPEGMSGILANGQWGTVPWDQITNFTFQNKSGIY